MTPKYATLTVLTAALCSAACLKQETIHTLYLMPDGAVTWTAIERDIRSDAREPEERRREEQQFLDRFAAGEHPVLAALRSLDAINPRARLVRRERPYMVLTEARFERIDRLMQGLLDGLRISGTVTLTHTADQATLSVAYDVPDGEPEGLDESAVLPLLGADGPLRVVLTGGRFVSATGFTIEDDTVAVFDEDWMNERCEPGATVRLSLTWIGSTPNSQEGELPKTPNSQKRQLPN